MAQAEQHLVAPAVAEEAHHETNTGVDNRKLGMWLFLASDCMFFAALIIGYLVYVGKSHVGPYPHDLFDIPLTTVSTFVLLMSSLSMVLSVNGAKHGNTKEMRRWLLVTILGGLTFLGFQAYEYTHFISSGLTLKTNLFGTSFYGLTGFHGIHVAIGVMWLTGLLIRSYKTDQTREQGIWVDIAGLYWHFVDLVWIVVFTVVYLLDAVRQIG